jgi:hypothetical protein
MQRKYRTADGRAELTRHRVLRWERHWQFFSCTPETLMEITAAALTPERAAAFDEMFQDGLGEDGEGRPASEILSVGYLDPDTFPLFARFPMRGYTIALRSGHGLLVGAEIVDEHGRVEDYIPPPGWVVPRGSGYDPFAAIDADSIVLMPQEVLLVYGLRATLYTARRVKRFAVGRLGSAEDYKDAVETVLPVRLFGSPFAPPAELDANTRRLVALVTELGFPQPIAWPWTLISDPLIRRAPDPVNDGAEYA